MKKLLALVFSLLISFNSLGETVLYCQGELATGLDKNNGTWKTSNFNTERYTIKFSDDYYKLSGLSKRNWDCLDAYFDKTYNTVTCTSPYQDGGSFTFNKKTNRFITINSTVFGYLDNGTDNSAISAGTCQKF